MSSPTAPEPATRPVMGPPPGRYGREPSGRSRALRLAVVAVLGLLAAGWLIWTGLHNANRDVRWSDIGYSVRDDGATTVTFDVVKDADRSARCWVHALNRHYAPVGVAEVEIGPAPDTVVRTTANVRTTERAVSGLVRECMIID